MEPRRDDGDDDLSGRYIFIRKDCRNGAPS